MKYLSFLMLMVLIALPEQTSAGLVSCTGLDCNFCELGSMTNAIVNWVIGFAAILAVVTFVIAGFQLLTSGGDVKAMEYAKARLQYVVIGFIIMLSAWLLIDTILSGLTGKGMNVWGSFDANDCGSMAQPKAVEYEEGEVMDNSSGVYDLEGPEATLDIPSDNAFGFRAGISNQKVTASDSLNALLNCMSNRVPGDVGQISSISHSSIADGSRTFAQCRQGGCQHSNNSCHFGNRGNDLTHSYAVDFGDEENWIVLKNAAIACGGRPLLESDHVHVSTSSCGG